MELRSILNSTKVGDLTLRMRPSLQPDHTIEDAAREMRQHSHGSAAICDGDKLVGIFTERDLLGVVAAGTAMNTPLSEVMTANPHSVTTDDTLFEATQSMDTGGYRRLPVIDANSEKPIGFLDVKGIVHFLVEHYPAAVHNQAALSQVITKDREGP